MIEQPTQVRKPLVDDILILALLVLNDAGVSLIIDPQGVHPSTKTGGVLAGKKVHARNLMKARLEDFLNISLNNPLAVAADKRLHLPGRFLGHFK